MQDREICYEIDLETGFAGIELESLRQVFDAVEKQLPDHGKFKINIGGIRIDTNNLKQTNSNPKSNITYEIEGYTDDVYTPYIAQLTRELSEFEKYCNLKGNVNLKLAAYIPSDESPASVRTCDISESNATPD